MRIDRANSEASEAEVPQMEVDDAYYAEVQKYDLLTREQAGQLSARIQAGNRAYTSLIGRMRTCLTENTAHPDVQKLLAAMRDTLPLNFVEKTVAFLEKAGTDKVPLHSLSAEALNNENADMALLCAAFDVFQQKMAIHLALFGQRIAKEDTIDDDNVDVDQFGSRLLHVITLMEKCCLPIVKELANPALREIIETKEPVIRFGEQARNTLRTSNLRLVGHWAKKCQGRGLELKDLLAEGNFGLMKAVEYFDGTMGFKFSTYATTWIKHCIHRALGNQSRDIRLPAHLTEQLFDFRKRVDQLTMGLNRPISDDEAITIIGYEETEAEALKHALQMDATRSISFEYGDTKYGGKGEGRTLGEGLEDPRSFRSEEEIEQEEFREEKENTFDVLKTLLSLMEQKGDLQKWECEIIRLRLGLDDNQPRKLEEIADIYGVTRERIRQIQDKALKKLETKMAIIKTERTATTSGKENTFSTYTDVVDIIEHRLKVVRSEPIMKLHRNKIEELLAAVLNTEEEKVVRLRIGLDGPAKSQPVVGTELGLRPEQVTFIQSAALDWLRAAVESPYQLSSIEAPVADDDETHGRENFTTLLEYIHFLCSHQPVDRVRPSANGHAATLLAPQRTLKHGEVVYFDGKDASMNLDSIFAGKNGHHALPRQAAQKQKTRSAREAFERLFGEVAMQEETEATKNFPPWMRLLSETAATRLHALLLRSITMADVRDIILKAEPGFARKQEYLEKALGDCFVRQEQTAEMLRTWILRLNDGGSVQGKFISSYHFLRAAENEKLIIPNVRDIIARHFAGSSVPIAERKLIVAGDIHCAPGFRDLFGGVIPLLKRERLRGMINVPEMFKEEADVIILGHLSEMLRYEDDEKALLWAQSCLKPGGITIVIANDKVPEVPSRAHFRQRFNTYGEHILSITRYQEYLSGHGFPVETGRATLNLESRTEEGLTATGELLRFTLPAEIQSRMSHEDLDAYVNRYVRDRAGEGHNVLRHSLAFLVAHENPNARFAAPTPETILSAVARRMNDEMGAEELKTLFSIPHWQNKATDIFEKQPDDDKEFWHGLQALLRKMATEGRVSMPAPDSRVERSYAKDDVSDNKEYFKLYWQYQRLLHGRKYGRTREQEIMASLQRGETTYADYLLRPSRTMSKKQFSKPLRQFNPKVEKRYRKKLRLMNEQVLHLREENPYTIDTKIGEIDINGIRCAKLRNFASVYDLDLSLLKEAIHECDMQPAGFALKQDSEHDASELGGRTAVFALDALLQIPYVKAKVRSAHDDFLVAFSEEKPVSLARQRNPLLKELDADIASEQRIATIQNSLKARGATVMKWKLYADGSRFGGDNRDGKQRKLPGGWACIVKDGIEGQEQVRSGAFPTATVDRMELMGVVQGLQLIRDLSPDLQNTVKLYDDSKYVFRRLLELLAPLRREEFLRRSKVYDTWRKGEFTEILPQSDPDLREALRHILATMEITYIKVEKVTAPEEHARCDAIAGDMQRKLAKALGYRKETLSSVVT